MDKYIGRLLDNRYEILEVIGTGGMAVVYKARCHRLNRLVAIKILKDDYLEDEEFRRRFHSESQAVAMLSHPNIVSIYDVSTSITADYIVMELIDGITLKQYMEKKGVLNWKETLHFAIQISKALEHAHGRGIVHRDIKPHNVMVLKNGSVKVTDFGIARMMSKGNTLTKEALGSVHYISPEQAKGGRVDSRSDIYSLGVVLYEMMSGRPPYDGESPVSVAIQHINGGAVMPSTLNPNIPGGLEQIIMKAMAHEPEQRYDSATQMLADMDNFRKDPAILFDYNTPPTDAVTMIPKSPVGKENEEKLTTAERVERQKSGTGVAAAPPTRKPGGNAGSGQDPQRRRRQEPKQNNTATVAIIACCLLLIVAIIVFLVILFSGGGSKTELVTVPYLLGQVYEELPEYPDFKIKLEDRVHDNTYPAGQIISQTPEDGTQMEKGKEIYVVVSLGKAEGDVTMPNVIGWDLSQAEKTLNSLSMNLQLVVEWEAHEEIQKDCVIRTEPAAETELLVGQEIKIIASLGVEEKTSTMPDVVGDKKESALKVLESQKLDLDVVIEEVYDSLIPVGDVIRTEPAKNAELKTGQTVTIYVSKGAELKKMQDLVGLPVDTAVSFLKGDGFNNYEIEPVTSDKNPGIVVEQSEKANTMVDVNTKIILKYSKGTITKKITITIPTRAELAECGIMEKDYTSESGVVSLVLTLRQGNTDYYTSNSLDFSSNPITVTLDGSGVQEYELLVNGKKFKKITVEFTE